MAVIGAGLMGHGIALTFARAGRRVAVHDPFPAALEALHGRVAASMKAIGAGDDEVAKALEHIEPAGSIAVAVAAAEVVIEAAPEKPDLKQAIFAEIEAHAPREAILASNTSVIPITTIVGGLARRERALGTHWWNPPHQIPLVEMIRTEWTSDPVLDRMEAILAEAGKSPVRVEKDVPGFIGNRLQHAMWREAISLVEHGICSAEAVDTVVKQSFGRRLSVLGPLENADLVGLDLTLDIHRQILADLEALPGPSPYLEKLVAEGRLGMKTGQGFIGWTKRDSEVVRLRVADRLRALDTLDAAGADT